MPARTNKKFVIVLAVAVLGVFAVVAVVGAMALRGRPAGFVRKADALVAQGQYKEAAELYERAVGKDRTNREWLEKWRDALIKTTPESTVGYGDQYNFYRNILRQIALLDPANPEPTLVYMRELDSFIRAAGGSREALESIIQEVDEREKDLKESDPQTKLVLLFRGLAQADRMGIITVPEPERQQAIADIRGAVEAFPENHEARIGIVRWLMAEVERLRKDGRQDQVGPLLDEARAVQTQAIKDFPQEPEVILSGFLLEQGERLRAAVSPQARKEAVAQAVRDGLSTINTMLTLPEAKMTPLAIERAGAVLLRTVGADGLEPMMALIDRAMVSNPNDARLLMMRGQLLQDQGKTDEAIATYQKVVDLPAIPISIEGLLLPDRRVRALAMQVDAALVQWGVAETEDERNAAVKKAKEYRDRLAADSGVRGRDALLLRDAKIAYAERRYDETVAKLSELRSLGAGGSPEILQLLAQALEVQQNFGESIRVVEELRDLIPGMSWSYRKLGDLNARVGRMEEAVRNYEIALAAEPDDRMLKERIATLATVAGKKVEDDSMADPVVRAIYRSREVRREGDAAAGRKILEDLSGEMARDMRVLRELVQLDVSEGKRPEALARVQKAIETQGSNQTLEQMKVYLEIDNPVEASLKIIDATDASPLAKLLNKFSVYVSNGRSAEAQAALAEAEKLAPDDASVVDLLFVVALGEKNFDRAQQIVQKAAKLNLDQADGLLYQGRLELIEGQSKPEKLTAAATTFEAVVKRLPYNPTARRLLAQTYQRIGRVGDALEQYRSAYEGNPNDAASVRDYVQALIASNRGSEARTILDPQRGALASITNDADLYRTWVDLEAVYGDRALALRTREAIYKTRPEDVANGLSLASMYVEEQRWEDADRVIGEVEKRGGVDSLNIALLRAQISARRGDLDAGVRQVQDVIAGITDRAESLRAYITLASFLEQNNRADESAAALRKAREFQDPNQLEADRALGDQFFSRGVTLDPSGALGGSVNPGFDDVPPEVRQQAQELLTSAMGHYNEVLKGVKDEAVLKIVRKRAAETSIRLGKLDDAGRLVEQIAAAEPTDLQVLLLQGTYHNLRKDRRVARQFYDRAVELNPSDPNAFMQRALFNLSAGDASAVSSLMPDILQDFEQVTRLRPAMLGAWVRRYALLKETDRIDEGFGILRSAIEANPQNEDLRKLLMSELLGANRLDEAQREVTRAIEAQPNRTDWLLIGAQLFASPNVQRWREASNLLEQYYEKNKTPENAGRLLDALLRPDNSPARTRVQNLLAEFDKTESKTMGAHLLRARAKFFTSQDSEGEKHLLDALALVGEAGQSGREFLTGLSLAKGGNEPAIRWIQAQPKDRKLPVFLRAQVLVFRSLVPNEPFPELIEEAKGLVSATTDPMTLLDLHKMIMRASYTIGAYEPSVEHAIKALEISPNDIETNNNVAYTLVTHLNRAEEALPYAQKAVALAPDRASIIDTLGWTYFKLEQYAKAVESLTMATERATDPNDLYISTLHLAAAQERAGDLSGARRTLRKAEEIATRSTNPPIAPTMPEYATLFETLKKNIQ